MKRLERTIECLKKAIDGESTAVEKYKEFKKVAEEEGLPNVAYLFKALIIAESYHIRNHKQALLNAEKESHLVESGQEKTTYKAEIGNYEVSTVLENIKAAVKGETEEYMHMYPDFLKKVKKERKAEATRVAILSMEWARDVEKTHAEVLKMALADVEKGHDFEVDKIFVCRFCGNLVLSEIPNYCPVCRHDPQFYTEISWD